ncbi:MAG: sarcosine oxidase subunit alpha, partial [Rhodobacterales bacterium]|nr:sarcosine oxidase subunit alpha [Rhodobacterales bacterium]
LDGRRTIDGQDAADWLAAALAELAANPDVRVLTRTTAFGYYDQNYVCLLEKRTDHLRRPPEGAVRQRVWHVRARRVVLATGAQERPLVFVDNDRPGIMLAGAVRTYVDRFAALPGACAVLFVNNDAAYETAISLHRAGARVAAVVDARAAVTGALPDQVRDRGIPVFPGHVVVATHGRKRIRAVDVMPLGPGAEKPAGPKRTIECDLLAVSGGYSPVVHLFSQAQGRLRFDETTAAFLPDVPREALACAGSLTGAARLADCLAQGLAAGAAMAAEAGFGDGAAPAAPVVDEPDPGTLEPLWLVPGVKPVGHGGKAFVDLQNDTSAADILLAAREGMESVEHMKRYTLAGFGTDQGKTSNINALAILSGAVGRSIPETGTTTFRPPYTPVTFGAMAGRDVGILSDPARETAMHTRHQALGAVFEDVGQWKRPWYYPRDGETMELAVRRECLAVRHGVGVLDASTLGKIDIVGPDAAEFLNRIYTNAWKKLGLNRIRYGLMLGEDGMVFDDGTTTRLAEDHYLMTTTTGGAARVLDWLEEWLQTEWTDLKVHCTSVTEQWAVTAVAGPKAGQVMARLAPDLDLDPDAFPFMAMREATVAGLPARVYRISFTGELSYEINVAWHHGRALWDAVMAAGADLDITPYGTETMHVLRAEKGFIIVGQDTDGTQTPHDLGMDWIVGKTKGDFIGRRSFARPDTRRADRKHLVGLLTDDPEGVLPEGAQVILPEDRHGALPRPMLGHVTSSYYSAALGHAIALALVKGGRDRLGQAVLATTGSANGAGDSLDDVTFAGARIVDPVFYDREGSRKDG